MRNNPLVQLLAVLVVFLFGAAIGGMVVKIQYLEQQVKNAGSVAGAVNNQGNQGNGGNQGALNQEPTSVDPKVTVDDPVKGDPKAKLTIVEFADFQCPFCGRFHKDTFPQIVKDYVDSGKAKFVYKQLAILGKESTDASIASLCAKEQNKFWEYYDHLYSNQSGENQGAFSPDNLKKFAGEVGLNAAQFGQCLDDQKYADQVAADVAEASRIGFNSTPSVAVGSTPIVGAQPYAQFKTAIDAELAK